MAITLGTNIPSLIANAKLATTTEKLQDTMIKLSTGTKINCAGDDAAGLVISQNMQAEINCSRQAQQNIQTSKSFLTIAEGGMISISDHMQRINDLLTNMANDTNDISSRTATVNEIIERLDEINRLAETTNFNGRKMLDGSAKSIIIQMGPDTTEDSIIEIASALSDCHTYASKTVDGVIRYGLDIELPDNLNPYKFKDFKYKIENSEDSIEGPLYQANLGGQKVYYATDPETTDNPDYYTVNTDASGITTIKKYKYSTDKYELDTTYGTNGVQTTDANSFKAEQDYEPNNENCRNFLAKIQNAIDSIATKRGLLGAYENRMDSSYDALTSRIENLEEAKTTYTDTDIASESTKYYNAQIFQQLNVAMLSCANNLQQLALSLIGG